MDTKPAPIFRTMESTKSALTWRSLVQDVRDGELLLDAPYQRGHVWGTERQLALIYSITLGMDCPALHINQRDIHLPAYVIDGKQRLTAVRRWMDGDLTVPSHWFQPFNPHSQSDEAPVAYLVDPERPTVTYTDGLTRAAQLTWAQSFTVPVNISKHGGPDAEQRERVIFDLLNNGGLPQGAFDADAYQPPSAG